MVRSRQCMFPGHLYYSGAFDYIHADWLGTGRLATSIPASGDGALYYDHSFSPYGEMYGSTGTIYSQSFTGDTQDLFVGLFDTDNRELNQSQGRWLDPAGQGWNQYAYVTNPNSETDPLGLGCAGDVNSRSRCLSFAESGTCGGGAGVATPCSPVYIANCQAEIDGDMAGPCGLAFGSTLSTNSGSMYQSIGQILGATGAIKCSQQSTPSKFI